MFTRGIELLTLQPKDVNADKISFKGIKVVDLRTWNFIIDHNGSKFLSQLNMFLIS